MVLTCRTVLKVRMRLMLCSLYMGTLQLLIKLGKPEARLLWRQVGLLNETFFYHILRVMEGTNYLEIVWQCGGGGACKAPAVSTKLNWSPRHV